MAISEEMKKILEGSEEGKKLLSEMAAQAAKSTELENKLKEQAERQRMLEDKLIDPEYLAKIAGVVANKPSAPAQDDSSSGADFDNLSPSEQRKILKAELKKELQDVLKNVKEDYGKKTSDLYRTIMLREVDEVKSYSDFEKLKDEVQNVYKENPNTWPREAARIARQRIELKEKAKAQDELLAKVKQKEEQQKLQTERPDEAIAALQTKEISNEEAVKKAIELCGLPGDQQ